MEKKKKQKKKDIFENAKLKKIKLQNDEIIQSDNKQPQKINNWKTTQKFFSLYDR